MDNNAVITIENEIKTRTLVGKGTLPETIRSRTHIREAEIGLVLRELHERDEIYLTEDGWKIRNF